MLSHWITFWARLRADPLISIAIQEQTGRQHVRFIWLSKVSGSVVMATFSVINLQMSDEDSPL